MKIIKRSGEEQQFDAKKIEIAITKANNAVPPKAKITEKQIKQVTANVIKKCEELDRVIQIEEIQDFVEDELMLLTKDNPEVCKLARAYLTYRYKQSLKRRIGETDDKILSLIQLKNEEAKTENSNKNPAINSTQRDYMAGEISRDLTRRILLPPDIMEAHDNGIIHFHDTDYSIQRMTNCCLINLDDMLQNGTIITDTLIEKPKSFRTACTITTQIVAQVSSNQYGGQSISLAHLAPFVDISRQKLRKHVRDEFTACGLDLNEEKINKLAEERLRKEVSDGVQTIQYQVTTLLTTNGQAPFITVWMYLNEAKNEQEKADLALIIEEVLKQRYKGTKNKVGVYVTPAFPKLVYALEDDNTKPGDKYWYLTELAAKCTAKRMVPDYVSEKMMLKLKVDKTGNGACYPPMGCRSFLTPDRTKENLANAGNYNDKAGKYYGRFNQGVVTINLPDVALSSHRDTDEFWKIFNERLELCHRALQLRHKHLLGTPSDVAPILWQHGAYARLNPGEKIDRLLYDGYSTISLGYAGLYECVKYMTGYSHTDDRAKDFALSVMKHMNDMCAKWKAEENIDYSIYGTPIESTTGKFAKCLQRRFGEEWNKLGGRDYITNSYHVPVFEKIDAFKKLKFESEFQHLSPGGAISYVEVPNMQDNIEAVLSIMQFIYDNIMYAELNTKSDYCQCCGYDGEIHISEEDGKIVWRCPNCGNTDQTKMNVARRTCGYIGSQWWSFGRSREIMDRTLHVAS